MEERCKFEFHPDTIVNHQTHILNYLRFCIYFNLLDFLTTDITLALYSEFLFGSYKSPASVLKALFSIKYFHEFLGLSIDAFQSCTFVLTKRALPRLVRYEAKPVPLVTLELISSICNKAESFGRQGFVGDAVGCHQWEFNQPVNESIKVFKIMKDVLSFP